MATEKSPAFKLMKTPGKGAAQEAVGGDAQEVVDAPVPVAAAAVQAAQTITKAKGKAKLKGDAVADTGPVAEEDLIVRVAHEIENMKVEKAFREIPKLVDNIGHDYFKLGGVLSVIQSNGWFQDKGYENFRSFIESECGLKYRKGMHLIEIYNGLVESGVSWDQVKHLGWTKLRELAKILKPANVVEWVSRAEAMTVLQLKEYIFLASKATSTDGVVPVLPTSTVTTMTFKVHADQKATIREALDKAKHETGTDFDTVALEAMALDFLGGTSTLKTQPSLQQLMEGKSAEEVLEVFGLVFPDVAMEVTLPQ